LKILKNKTALIILSLLACVYCFFEAQGKGDFYIFISAADDLKRGENIFENKYVDGYHYYYSVLFALLLKPLTTLSFFWIKFAWLLLNVFLFFQMLGLLLKSELVQNLEERKRWVFLSVIFVFSLRFFLDNIHTSQITIVILASCVYGVYYIAKEKPIKGALILALGINIKLLPIVFLPYLIYRGYFKAFFITITFYLVFLILPSVFIGIEYNFLLLKTWLNLINPINQNHVLDVDERSFHGLSTLLSTLLVKDVPDMYALPLKRNIADISLSALSVILQGARLILVSFTLFFLGFKFFTKTKGNWKQCLEVSYILLIIPLIFPHQQHYAFLFAIPAVGCISYYLLSAEIPAARKKIIVLSLVVIYLTFNLKLLLGEFNRYYEHYKILTYGALLLIPLLAWVRRDSKRKLSVL